ncbi:MAG TPA: twin-arginine translocase TatA/TatE family subunit [Steroidobacteraceae bacterium]|nr:twin-arginine translocase TatA/TatE family subunit [Steroidobacteraceae bacterium]
MRALLLIAVILLLVLGTNKLRTIGSDLGEAVKGFRKAARGDAPPAAPKPIASDRPDAEFPEARAPQQPTGQDRNAT